MEFALSNYGQIDILVNGAAGNFLSEAKSLSPKGFKTVMEIDAQGTYNMSHAVYCAMAKSGGGKGGVIINISMTLHYGGEGYNIMFVSFFLSLLSIQSTSNRYSDGIILTLMNVEIIFVHSATWYQAHASAAKSAIDSLTRSLALEWGCDKIRVVGIAPGPIANTPGTTKLAPGFTSEDVNDMIAERIPLGRLGTAMDIGMAAVFLACDRCGGYISGDTLVVDGAEWLYKPPMVPREMVAELSRKVEAKSRALMPKVSKL